MDDKKIKKKIYKMNKIKKNIENIEIKKNIENIEIKKNKKI